MDFESFQPLNAPPKITKPTAFEAKKQIWTYECSLCRKRVRFDSDMEPLCTGTNESSDDHEMVVMTLVGVQDHGRIL